MRKRLLALTGAILLVPALCIASVLFPGSLLFHYGVIKPVGYPRIDYSNPLAVGLKGYWILNGSGPLINLVTGEVAVQNGTVTPSPTAAGMQANFQGQEGTASNYYLVHTGPFLGGNLNYSVATGAILNTNHSCQTNGGEYSIYAERAPTGNDIVKMAYCAGGILPQSTPVFTYRNDGGTLIQPGVALSTPYNDNKFHVSVTSKRGGGGSNNVTLYMDGKAFASASWSTNDNFTNSGILTEIGRDAAVSASGWSNYISFVAVWTVPLTAAQAASFSQNPYQFLIFPQDTIFEALQKTTSGPPTPAGGVGQNTIFGGFP